jgi:2-oxoglutarate dehydrogenase E2 component (dihydrolipoamide succinyltransferase)
MKIEINVPVIGESVTQAQIASWLVADGAVVEKNAEIAEIESDKATVAVYASETGKLSILFPEGATVNIGQAIGNIETEDYSASTISSVSKTKTETQAVATSEKNKVVVSPLAKQLIAEKGINLSEVQQKSGSERISRNTVLEFISAKDNRSVKKPIDRPGVTRQKMSPLRQKLAERLVSVRLNTAMLTTFNEVNMAGCMALKTQYGEAIKAKYGFSLGFVSFFAKACAIAIKDFPVINAMIEGDDILFHDFVDINIAVSSPKGLLTPVVKHVQEMSVPEIEQKIKEFGQKAAINRIGLDDLTLGTFTITNGGVFGSLMSTPIINPPQSAILGMHKISERAMVVNGKIEILPMMYVALSYDHRLIDGKESVSFLVKVKELLENPISSGLTGDEEFERFLS